ncbi:TPA: hypothetical protein ACGO9Y_001531 [Streptococcus suis]
MKDTVILINSCDAYSDVWEPFFKILEKTWPEISNYRIVLNTETKQYRNQYFDIEVMNILPGKTPNIPWGERLLDVLGRLEEKYVIFLLEDFFFEEKVNHTLIEKYLTYLKNNQDIATLSLTSPMDSKELESYQKTSLYEEFAERGQKAYYKLNAGPGIWRKSALVEFTRATDNPWEWEFFGSMRTWFSDSKFYGLKQETEPVFKYDIEHGGAVHRGKWVGYKLDEIIEKYNLTIDFSQRPIEYDWMADEPKSAPIWLRLPSILKNRSKAFITICGSFLKYRLMRSR